jgi:hypothetical protein
MVAGPHHLCFMGPHMRISWWAKCIAMHCNAFCSCPNAHQLADAHVRGAMETKMAAGWEYDELACQKLHP